MQYTTNMRSTNNNNKHCEHCTKSLLNPSWRYCNRKECELDKLRQRAKLQRAVDKMKKRQQTGV